MPSRCQLCRQLKPPAQRHDYSKCSACLKAGRSSTAGTWRNVPIPDSPEREARIAAYAERAGRGEPLFNGSVHLPAPLELEFIAVPKVIREVEFRTCRICNRLLPLTDFPKQHYFRKCDGARVSCRGNRCKECTNQYLKEWCRRKRARLREEEVL